MTWMTKSEDLGPEQARQRALRLSATLASIGFLMLAIAVVGLSAY
jgi:hypothetical protein